MTHQSQHDQDRSPADPEKPTTLIDFVKQYPDDATCARFLEKLRWPHGFICPACFTNQGWYRTDRGVWECPNGHQTSVTAGTMMHRTKIPLTTWFYAAYLVSTLTPGISALQLQRQLGLSRYETAFQLLHKLRGALVAPDRDPLRGEVEVDECFVGGEEAGRPGRGAETKVLVVVAVEVIHWNEEDPDNPERTVTRTRAGRLRASVIPDASAETLLPWIVENIQRGTRIHTDGWAGYNGLAGLGYDHVRNLQTHEGKKTDRYLPMVHLIISNLKRWWLGTHKGAIRSKHLQAYLNEFIFRFNRRFWRGPAFAKALGLLVTQRTPVEYDALYHAGEAAGWQHPDPRTPLNSADVDKIVDVIWAEVYSTSEPKVKRRMIAGESAYKANIRAAIKSNRS